MLFRRFISFWIVVSFFLTTLGPLPKAHAGTVLGLPVPGTMVNLTPAYVPVIAKGLRVHPENPILFDFIIDTGNSGLSAGDPQLKTESEKLIKYFLASLTIPEDDLWVNLSPYEKNRIIPDQLGQTEMGRDMLAEDYVLKQLTASLIYPEKDLGKEFWNRVYAKAQQFYGTSEIPVNTFNKVWIVADKAKVYVHANTAFVVASHLKVMLEEDYLALQKHNPSVIPTSSTVIPAKAGIHSVGSQIIRAIVLPELEKEVNAGKNFANLRQIFHSMILAAWYKKNLKQALLNQVYSNKAKINGVDVADKTIKEQIYKEYLKAYKKGVFNYIKEDIQNGQTVPRKYFSGGEIFKGVFGDLAQTSDPAELSRSLEAKFTGDAALVTVRTPNAIQKGPDAAMSSTEQEKSQDVYAYNDIKIGRVRQTAGQELHSSSNRNIPEWQKYQYFNAVLEYVYSRIVETKLMWTLVEDTFPEEFKLYIEGRQVQYRQQTGTEIFSNSFNVEGISGRRYVRGSETLPSADRIFSFVFQTGLEAPEAVLTFKGTKNGQIAFRVVPKKTVLIYGFGTISSKIAIELAKMGINVIAANRSPNERARLALDRGFPIVPLNDAGVSAYKDAGFNVPEEQGVPLTAQKLLEQGKIDLIVEGLDGTTPVVIDKEGKIVTDEDGKVMTKLPADVQERGLKIDKKAAVSSIYQKEVFDHFEVPVMYQGSNDPDVLGAVVSETGAFEIAQKTFQIAKNIFNPSCNTTAQLTLLTPVLASPNIKERTVSAHVITTRRSGDPGAPKSSMSADGFGKLSVRYHHASDAEAFFRQFPELLEKFAVSSEGSRQYVTHANFGPQTKFHQSLTILRAKNVDGTPLTAEQYKDMLRGNPRVALISTGKDDEFDASVVFNTLVNRMDRIHSFIMPVWVSPNGDDSISIVSLTPQESNVIPNNVTTSLGVLGLFNDNVKGLVLANEETNGSMELPKIKKALEGYLPDNTQRLTDTAMLAVKEVKPSIVRTIGDKDTLRVDVELVGGATGHFVQPAGTSSGEDERKTENNMAKVLGNVQRIHAEVLRQGINPEQLAQIGQLMLEMDSENFLGAQATLAYQMALAWAVARSKGLELDQLIREIAPDLAPEKKGSLRTKIQYNITNGGAHAENALDIQEFMAVPTGRTKAESNIMADNIDRELGLVYQALGLQADPNDHGLGDLRGLEGGYSIPNFTQEKLKELYENAYSYNIKNLNLLNLRMQNVGLHEFIFNALMAAIKNAGYTVSKSGKVGTVALAIDVASSEMYDRGSGKYSFEGRLISSEEWTKILQGWVKTYPIDSIEDAMDQNDWDGWMKVITALGDDVLLIGDDNLVTQAGRLMKLIEKLRENGFIGTGGKVTKKLGILIKLNQNGFLTTGIDDPKKGYLGTLEVIRLARQYGIEAIISHRSKEAQLGDNEVSIADIAAGVGAYGFKSGDYVQRVRGIKEDRLAEIERREIAADALSRSDAAMAVQEIKPLGKLRNGVYSPEQAKFNIQMDEKFGQRLLRKDETVIKAMVKYFDSFPSKRNINGMYFYQWIQNHQSYLSANVIAAIGLENYSPFFLYLLSEIASSKNPDGNPRAAARQIIEMAEQGTIGGYPVIQEFQTQAKGVLKLHPEFRSLAQWVKAPAYPVVPKGQKPGYLLLVRHGETSWNEPVFNKWAGWLGAEVTEKGKEDTLNAGQEMNKLKLNYAVSSDLTRALQTMQYFLIGKGDRMPIWKASALREKSYGFVAGWRRSDVEKIFGDKLYTSWRRAPDGRAPGGENFMDTKERVEDYLVREILPRIARGENVVISAHGNSLRALIAALREHSHQKSLTEKEIIKLEVAQAAPIGITFDENMNHQDFWTQEIGAPAVQEALLNTDAAMTSSKMGLNDFGRVYGRRMYGKIVVVREGYDVTLDKKGNLANPDDPRIIESLPTIQYLMGKGAKVVLIAHLGRPKEQIQKLIPLMGEKRAREAVFKKMSLAPVAKKLTKLLRDKFMLFNPDFTTIKNAKPFIDEMKSGEVMLLENLRFNEGEENNDPDFAKELFDGAYAYVNDAPSVNHRENASIVNVPANILRVMGNLTKNEMEILKEVRKNAKLAVIGGVKISGKISVIKQFLLADQDRRVLIGGAMANAFLKAKDINIQKSVGDGNEAKIAKDLLDKFNKGTNQRITIPHDVVAVDNFANPTQSKVIDFSSGGQVPENWTIVDIGPETTKAYVDQIDATTFWNGPMGAYDKLPKYASDGTKGIAEAVAFANGVVGGGDSVAAWNNDSIVSPLLRNLSYARILTGGGASLEFLEGKPLPGIEALSDAVIIGKIDSMVDKAALAQSPGGIDLNARNMNMDVSGEKIDIRFDKATIEQFKRGDFSGVRPVIITITPILNVMSLLGLKEDERLAGV